MRQNARDVSRDRVPVSASGRPRALLRRIRGAMGPSGKTAERPAAPPSHRDPYTAGFPTQASMEDVAAAYRLFLRRRADQGGIEHYRGLTARGLPLDELISVFMNSDEYRHYIVPLLPGELKAEMGRQSGTQRIVTVDLGGYTVCLREADQDFAPAIRATREYEPHVCRFLSTFLRPGHVVVDVGANVGCIAFLASRLVGPTGAVIAVEPNPDNLQLLYAGLVLNELANVRVLPYGASDRRRVLSLKGGTSNTYLVAAGRPDDGVVYAQAVPLDEELAGLDRIDLVKMDVEGHEPRALAGAAALIRKHRPTLVTEFNPRCLEGNEGIVPREYAEQLLAFYRSLWITTSFGDWVECGTATAVLDHWQRRNAELVGQGLLADGMLTFDLVATNETLEAPARPTRGRA